MFVDSYCFIDISDGAYGWTVEEMSELKNSDFILAADGDTSS